MAWWRPKNRKTDEADIRFLYLLCLGEEAHNESEYKRRKGTSLHGTAANLLGSKTFRNKVLSVAATPHALPHHSLDGKQKAVVVNGLLAHYGIKLPPTLTNTASIEPASSKSGNSLQQSKKTTFPSNSDWFQILKAAYEHPRLIKAFRVNNSEAVLEQFQETLGRLGKTGLPPIEGAIDEVVDMTCRGWALNTDTVQTSLRLNFYINQMFIGQITADKMRRDLEETYGGSGRFGFEHTLNIPQALTNAGRLVLRIKDAATGMPICPAREIISDHIDELSILQRTSHLLVGSAADQSEGLKWALPALGEYSAFPLQNYDLFAQSLNYPSAPENAYHHIHFTVIIYVGADIVPAGMDADANTAEHNRHTVDPAALTHSRDSIDGQHYQGRVTTLTANHDNFCETLQGTKGDFILFLNAGDRLHPEALAWFAEKITTTPDAALIYVDHDFQTGIQHYRSNPYFKPVFDYDLLLTSHYIGRAYAVKRGILETFEHLCGAATTPAESMDSYGGTAGLHLDLQLQIFEKTGDNGFAHIPQVLWHFAPDVDNPAQNHTDILNAHFSRTGSNAFAVDHSDPFGKALPHASKIIWQQANEENPHQPSTGGTEVEKLAIIIPSKNALDLIRPCTESLIATVTATDQIEIIIMDNGSDDAVTLDWLKAIDNHPMVKVIRHDHPFNWAEINNNAVDHTDAKHLLFLNNDTLALEQGWDMVLRSLLRRSEIGAVGARLLYEDGTIQHGGVLLYDTSVAVHEAAGQTCDNPHYMFRSALPHHTSAVTGAFLACTKENFAQVHGFDEQFRIIFNDIDFCLKLRAQGLKILYSPDITFNHLESKSRGYDHQDSEKARRAKAESNKMKEKWGDTLKEDPYYPAIFARSGKPYSRIESLKQKI